MMGLLRDLTQVLFAFYHQNELLALFVILIIEEAGIPMPPPGYTLLLISGAQPGRTFLSGLSVILVASLAVFLGSYFTFNLTRRYGREHLLRYARWLRVKESRIAQMEQWMGRYGLVGIFAGRLIPGLRVPS